MSPTAQRRIEMVWRALGIVTAIILIQGAVAGWIGLPGRVDRMQHRVDSLATDHSTLVQHLERLETGQKEMLCLDIATREHQDWRSCILKYGLVDSLP